MLNGGGSKIKRVFDIAASAMIIILVLPLLLVSSMLVLIFMGRPVIFGQKRPGYRGTPFTIYKLRTMKNPDGSRMEDGERMTALGKIFRSMSLDELPELFNVLKGDMSLVGPRPLLMEYLGLYSGEQERRHTVRPGMTGWAQINGRNAITWEEKFSYDLWYIDNWSLWLDIKILFRTLLKVLRMEGVRQKGSCTSEKFKGTS